MVDGNKSLEKTTFQRLSRLYFIALGAIALSIIISQILVQRHLNSQLDDSRVVNVAGRQRMLSQKLTKETLLLYENNPKDNRLEKVKNLQKTLRLWEESHLGLQQGSEALGLPGNNSPLIHGMFAEIAPYHQKIAENTKQIISTIQQNPEVPKQLLEANLQQVLENEQPFLALMDALVFQYDREARQRVNKLKRTELILLLIGLGILIAELIFLFRPTAIRIRNIIKGLVSAENSARKMTDEVEELYKIKEQSLNELRALNFAVDQAALFASASIEGKVIYVSEKFCNLLGLKKEQAKGQLAELMTANEGEQEDIKTLFKVARSSIWNGEINVTTQLGKKLCLEMSIVPVNRSGVKQDLLILCSDVTSRKIAQTEIDRLKEEQFHEQINQQKLRSSQVIEAQEEERKRIAKDMHDGIGQMLTALKFNLQSIDLTKPKKAKEKILQINELSAGLIRGVRIATFNLTPPELSDYGIASGLKKLASELSKLTAKRILFENRTNFDKRFDSIIETNLYRIIQEAVNNAIKYADSNYILIALSHGDQLLSIVIDDDGKGFDLDNLKDQPSEEGSGMGISFMRERVSFINGRIFIRSAPSKGTRITINVPI